MYASCIDYVGVTYQFNDFEMMKYTWNSTSKWVKTSSLRLDLPARAYANCS